MTPPNYPDVCAKCGGDVITLVKGYLTDPEHTEEEVCTRCHSTLEELENTCPWCGTRLEYSVYGHQWVDDGGVQDDFREVETCPHCGYEKELPSSDLDEIGF